MFEALILGSVIYLLSSLKKYPEPTNFGQADYDISQTVRKGLIKKRDQHNEKYGDTKSRKVSLPMLSKVFKKGVGAYYTNPQSVRSHVKSPEEWAYARVNSFLYAVSNDKFRSGKHDTNLLPKTHKLYKK